MIRSKCVVIASVLLLVFATGCNNQDESDQAVVSTPMAAKKKPKAKASPGATPAAKASPGKAQTAATPGSPQQAKQPAAKASPGKGTAGAKTDAKQTLAKLNGYLPAAVKALQDNDIDTAKQYAQDFNANWNQKIIQYSVKNQSQGSYKKISDGVNQVNKLMQSATPDKDKAIAALQSLSKSVQEYAKAP